MSTTRLKIIALIAMLIDHIGEFIPNMPIYFRWIGRISAPIFFFCTALGFYYTKDKKTYLLRMYLFGFGMSLINLIVNLSFKTVSQVENNIFSTLFVMCFIIYLINLIYNNKKNILYLVLFIIVQILVTILIIILDYIGISWTINKFIVDICGNIFFVEGGIAFVTLGILFYYIVCKRTNLIISYSFFCLIFTILYSTNIVSRILIKMEVFLPVNLYKSLQVISSIIGINIYPIYHIRFFMPVNYYWMIIFALPFILLYNGKKGKGYKYFFYIFYPTHIYILFLIGHFL
jgi:hypothetical protein